MGRAVRWTPKTTRTGFYATAAADGHSSLIHTEDACATHVECQGGRRPELPDAPSCRMDLGCRWTREPNGSGCRLSHGGRMDQVAGEAIKLYGAPRRTRSDAGCSIRLNESGCRGKQADGISRKPVGPRRHVGQTAVRARLPVEPGGRTDQAPGRAMLLHGAPRRARPDAGRGHTFGGARLPRKKGSRKFQAAS